VTILPTLRDQANVVRRVSGQSHVFVEDVEEEAKFACLFVAASSQRGGDDASPREAPSPTLRYAHGYGAPENALRAGDRVRLIRDGQIYELLDDPKALRGSTQPKGWDVPVMNIETLYPYDAWLTEQDGTMIAGSVRVAIYGGSDTQREEGRYENREGEAPVEYAEALSGDNVILRTPEDKYRVTSAVVDVAGPRVKIELRRAGG
jgi:hypothetical protein